MAEEVTSHPLEGAHGRLRRCTHKTAYLLRGELKVDTVGRQIVRTRGLATELRVAPDWHWAVLLELLDERFDARRRRRVAAT